MLEEAGKCSSALLNLLGADQRMCQARYPAKWDFGSKLLGLLMRPSAGFLRLSCLRMSRVVDGSESLGGTDRQFPVHDRGPGGLHSVSVMERDIGSFVLATSRTLPFPRFHLVVRLPNNLSQRLRVSAQRPLGLLEQPTAVSHRNTSTRGG